jgi:transposase
MSSTRASWLFVSQPEKLDEKQRQSVEQSRQAHLYLEAAYQLGQGFVMMLRERRDKDLDTWLTQAEQSGLPEFKKMAKGIRLDYTAVKAPCLPTPQPTQDFQPFVQFFSAASGVGVFSHRREISRLEA